MNFQPKAAATVEAVASADLQMMRFVAEGDERARRMVAKRLVGRVARLARALMPGHPDAEDAAQLALMEVLRSAPSYRAEGSLERWADRIAVRVILRHAKRERERRGRLERALRERLASSTSIRSDELSGTASSTLMRLLARLPEPRQQALVLKYGLGYSVRELAQLLELPLGTVKDRLMAGKKELRQLLHEEGYELGRTGDRRRQS